MCDSEPLGGEGKPVWMFEEVFVRPAVQTDIMSTSHGVIPQRIQRKEFSREVTGIISSDDVGSSVFSELEQTVMLTNGWRTASLSLDKRDQMFESDKNR